jgi:excisionase family DNA binding protein
MPRTKAAPTIPPWLATLAATTRRADTVGVQQVAVAFGVCIPTVMRWISTGRLAAPKIGGQRVITRQAVEQLLANRGISAPGGATPAPTRSNDSSFLI